MNDFCICLLKKLIDNYNNSVLSKAGSKRNLKIKLPVADKIFSDYRGRGAFKHIEEIDASLATLAGKEYILINRDSYGRLISVELNISAVEEIQKVIGYENRNDILQRIIDTFNNFPKRGFLINFADSEIDYIKQKYTWHKSYYENEKELVFILKILSAIANQTEEIMERDFSVRVLGDSKAFALYKCKIAKIAKKFDDALAFDDDDTEDDILLNYNIVKNSTYALIKGSLQFRLNNQVIELNRLGFEYSLSDEMIKQLQFLPSNFRKLITIENLTTFYKFKEENAVIVYLAGFHNHTKQNLLKKIYKNFQGLECYHFGDIDAGGFMIYNNLIKSTGIPFQPYKMGIAELTSNCGSLKVLTENDRTRLNNLLLKKEYNLFHEVITYMLENNVKLEQEILD